MWPFGTHAKEKYGKGNENAYCSGIIRQRVHTTSYSTSIYRESYGKDLPELMKNGQI